MAKYRVTYSGLFGHMIVRDFDTLGRAKQWARQVGVYLYAHIFAIPV